MTATNYWLTQTPLFLPDIGTFFNQDTILAKKLILQLADAGVTTIKGEILQNPDICLPTDTVETFYGHRSDKKISENYRTLIERKVVSLPQYHEMFKFAKSLGLEVILSVYDFAGADFAEALGCVAIKIASSNITHQPLIEYVAKKQLPMIFDTGHTTIEEASRAVSWARDQGNPHLLIEHSPPGPPNDVALHNLKFMNTLGLATQLPVGLSDHHYGDEMLYAAIAMGAVVLEKGVCDDQILDEQDAGHALPISQVSTVLSKLNNIQSALGNGDRYLSRVRDKYISRMGLVAKTKLAAGEQLSLENVTFAFPALGVSTEYWQEVQNFRVTSPINAGQPIHWRDIQAG
ncbi:N-acetylneuraminate synthase family protein [Thalassotalea fusca]